MTNYEYSGEMIEDILAVKRRSIELFEKATLAYYNQGSEFRAQQALEAISRLRYATNQFEKSIRRREEALADEREREAAE